MKSKIKKKNLVGDSLLIAASIVYLGPLTSKDWAVLRVKLSDLLATEFSIEVSKHWHNDSENDNPKLFKKILRSMGH